MKKDLQPTSEAELEVLKAAWELQECTVHEIGDALKRRKKRWAYTTILTFMRRLVDKGYLAVKKQRPANVYRVLVSRGDLINDRLKRMKRDVCENSLEPVLRVLLQDGQLSKKELSAVKKLLSTPRQSPAAKRRKKAS